ncbi:unnamed protein product [Ilex paraguariensis]|uniref:Uncharacterized protein n=1 Tax=Ilex paraguariensis TaxID=185542 RepID=A0ABC8SCQ7_9AQUA
MVTRGGTSCGPREGYVTIEMFEALQEQIQNLAQLVENELNDLSGGESDSSSKGRGSNQERAVRCNVRPQQWEDPIVENELNDLSGGESDSSSKGRGSNQERAVRCNVRPQQWEDPIVRALEWFKSPSLMEMEPDAFLNWMDSIKNYFDWKGMPKERKVELVGAKLKGPASTG